MPAIPPTATPQVTKPLIIVAASGTGGDILPFITLSQELQKSGHRIMMLVPHLHKTLIASSGVPFQTFSTFDEWQALLDDPKLWDERKGWEVIWRGLVPHLGAVSHLVRQLQDNEDCVVLSHPILLPMSALARSVRPNLRIVAAYLAPSNLCSSHDMLAAGSLQIPAWMPIAWKQLLWKVIHKAWIDPVTLPSLNAVRSQHGLPAVAHFFEHMLTVPDASVGLFPSWYAAVQQDWPQPFYEGCFVRNSEPSQDKLSPELEHFLSDGTLPIVFTPGTGHRHASSYFAAAAKVLKQLGRRGIFVTPHASQLPDSLAASIMWQAHVSFASLLPRVAAIVHHGGIGTIAEAFHAGIPQLIVPFAYDQFDNAQRAKRLGVADVLPAKLLSSTRMQKKLQNLLTSHEISQSCSRIAQKMPQEPGLPLLLDQIKAALFEGLEPVGKSEQ
ncbi:nucleotide disphospho-sugar-binding domain-containing protein [Aquitalea sp.]|uniref:nucleotide disphospho-sugar-binding domain-containing protein n=1 Tax=Aquitalea sp. TaxID=1872623 RepID=UPI0025891893|nr:nucleotide disphospho-sugar-binding domain-containing protein [Aquitalea sp.]